jgi:glycosyltransferase involved in cell wall biosynthesis
VIDDHSTDNTQKYLEEFSQLNNNFSYFESNGNGISDALNYGLAMSNTKYICRMDADDLMLPYRIESQLNFLEMNENFLAVGGQVQLLTNNDQISDPIWYPSGNHLEYFLAKGCYLAHPAVTFRTDAVKAIGGYRKRFDGAEDYDLWLRLSYFGALENLPLSVLKYRVHKNQVTNRYRFRTLIATSLVRLSWIFGITQKSLRNLQIQRSDHHLTIPRILMLGAFISDIINHVKSFLMKRV